MDDALAPRRLIDADPSPPTALTTFFNGACPIGRFAIDRHKALALARARGVRLIWCDVNRDPDALRRWGVPAARARNRLHVVDTAGRVSDGVDAIFAL